MKKFFTTRTIAGLGILLALEIIFQLIGNYVAMPVSINLSLIPIAMAAILYGPLAGFFIGVVNGVMVLIAPSTSIFYDVSIAATIIVCPLKTGIAGLLAGFLFRGLSRKNYYLAAILASVLVPIVNTGIFSAFALTVFGQYLDGERNNRFLTLVLDWIGINFLIEFAITVVISPAVSRVLRGFVKEKKKTEKAPETEEKTAEND